MHEELANLDRLSAEDKKALASLGPIFHYMGEWKPNYIHYRCKNGLFFGDMWSIPGSKLYVIYLGDELLFKLYSYTDDE